MPIYRIQQGERLMKKTQIIVMAILLAFLVSAQNATALTKSRAVLSPYFQTDVDSTYSFLGISHPSLSSAATTIGLTVATVGTTGATASQTFTIQAGETYRIFIVSTNHSTINNLTLTDAGVLFLATTSGSSEGALLTMTANKTEPAVVDAAQEESGGAQSLNMLSMWGAVVIPGTTSGFAMEFVGDAHDSNAVILSFGAATAGANAYIEPRNSNPDGDMIREGRGIN